MNGVCDKGCHPGWTGDYCDIGSLRHAVLLSIKNVKSYKYLIADTSAVHHKCYTNV